MEAQMPKPKPDMSREPKADITINPREVVALDEANDFADHIHDTVADNMEDEMRQTLQADIAEYRRAFECMREALQYTADYVGITHSQQVIFDKARTALQLADRVSRKGGR